MLVVQLSHENKTICQNFVAKYGNLCCTVQPGNLFFCPQEARSCFILIHVFSFIYLLILSKSMHLPLSGAMLLTSYKHGTGLHQSLELVSPLLYFC